MNVRGGPLLSREPCYIAAHSTVPRKRQLNGIDSSEIMLRAHPCAAFPEAVRGFWYKALAGSLCCLHARVSRQIPRLSRIATPLAPGAVGDKFSMTMLLSHHRNSAERNLAPWLHEVLL